MNVRLQVEGISRTFVLPTLGYWFEITETFSYNLVVDDGAILAVITIPTLFFFVIFFDIILLFKEKVKTRRWWFLFGIVHIGILSTYITIHYLNMYPLLDGFAFDEFDISWSVGPSVLLSGLTCTMRGLDASRMNDAFSRKKDTQVPAKQAISGVILCLLVLFPFSIAKPHDVGKVEIQMDGSPLIPTESSVKGLSTSGLIHVDNNWSSTASTYPWCTGAGTPADPYVIKDLVLNADDTNMILIQNTVEHFVIKNCTYKPVTPSILTRQSNIILHNVENGIIENNNCSLKYRGIYAENCDNLVISANVITNTSDHGIEIQGSRNVDIMNNNLSFNVDHDIYINYSHDVRIEQNLFYQNIRWGTWMGNVINSTVIANVFEDSDPNSTTRDSLTLYNCTNSTISRNQVRIRDYGSMKILHSASVNVERNLFLNCSLQYENVSSSIIEKNVIFYPRGGNGIRVRGKETPLTQFNLIVCLEDPLNTPVIYNYYNPSFTHDFFEYIQSGILGFSFIFFAHQHHFKERKRKK